MKIMKKNILSIMLVLVTNAVCAQTTYQYVQDSVYQTLARPVHIISSGGPYIHFAKAEPAYERFEPATSSNPAIIRNDEGFWEIDYSLFSKPSKGRVGSAIKSCLNQYLSILKPTLKGGSQAWITIRTDSQGKFKNADVKIWSEQSAYSQIPPMVLGQIFTHLSVMQFTVPVEYQCISDHYFHYYILFRDL